MNFYSYVSDDPVNQVDPFGLKEFPSNFIGPLPATGYRSSEMTMTACGPVPPHPEAADVNRNMQDGSHHWNPWWFKRQVQAGGPWDYKTKNLKYDDFGNFNYGAAGNAMGFRDNTLYREAGRAQEPGTGDGGDPGSRFNFWGGTPPYGDDWQGQIEIGKGIGYAKCMSGRNCGS